MNIGFVYICKYALRIIYFLSLNKMVGSSYEGETEKSPFH
jgi:hypothetical protein